MRAMLKQSLLTTTAAFFVAVAGARADTNLALEPGATGIFGYNNTGDISVLGTPYDHAGNATSVNDNNLYNSDDTYGQPNGAYGYVGVLFSTPVPSNDAIVTLNFYDSLFGDGGWFGVNGQEANGTTNHNYGDTLVASTLIAPTLQVTTDGGVTWTTVSQTNNYVATFTGVNTQTAVNNGYNPPFDATFTLTTPVSGIDGIRLIGEDGGYASGNGGFLGVRELQVETPEPSTWALMLGGAGLLAWLARRRVVSA